MKIAVLVSGGVDSSVALRLLHKEGHDLTAFYIKIWLEDELAYLGECPWEEDLRYAREVCAQIGVPLEVISLQKEYRDQVVAYTIRELKAGRTPNPDILCNQRIKFGQFYQKIDASFKKVATGHYAQIEEIKNDEILKQVQDDSAVFYLKKSADSAKDQTYFLSHLSQAQLKRALFPIGHLKKTEVRKLAKEFGLPNQDRKDSQGICFLGQVRFSEFVKYHLGTKRGDLVDLAMGKKKGEHDGYWFYTIGQRQGLGLGGPGRGPWYVAKKDIKNNIIYVTDEPRHKEKYTERFKVERLNWCAGAAPTEREFTVRIRHQGELLPCEVRVVGVIGSSIETGTNDSANIETGTNGTGTNDSVFVHLKQPAFDVAAGQFAAFYQDDLCLGGGVIG